MSHSRQNQIARQRVFDALAAQREMCDEAARERDDWQTSYLANALERMGELATTVGMHKQSRIIHLREFVRAG